MIRSKNGSHGNLIVVSAFLFLMLFPIANSLITYTATVAINPMQHVVTTSGSDSARMLKDITAESGADSSAAASEDILNLVTDGNVDVGKEIFNYTEDNRDYAHWYRIDSESSDFFKVEIRVYFSTLEVTPYEWQVFVYQSDADNINTGYYVDGSSSTTGWTSIDVSSIIHQLDDTGFMKVRLISRMGNGDEGKMAVISEMEWELTT